MVSVNSISSIYNQIAAAKSPSFKANEVQTNHQIKQLSNIQPDCFVKTPMAYTKTGEFNFPYGSKAHCYKLANGQKVVIVPKEGVTVLKTYVNTGSMNEPDNLRGISHYIEHNLFNGSEGLEQGDFFKQVSNMGAETNASTGFAETNYFISSNLLNDTDLETKIKLHASMLETPLFAVDKLEKEKGIVNSEINMIVSNPTNLVINKVLKNLYGINSTSTDMIGGTTDNITNLKREDVVNYFNNNYFPANMVTVVTGEVNPEETMKLLSKYFTSKKQPQNSRYTEQLKPTEKTVREDIISDKATATTIAVGFNGPSSDNYKDRIYMDALHKLLTAGAAARINNKIEKELNTYCIAEDEKITTNSNDGRAIIFSATCSDEKSEKVLKTIFNEIGNIANNPPTNEEMQIIKKHMINGFSNIFENSYGTNNLIGSSFLENNIDYMNQFEQVVNSMTAQDLVNAARKYLDLNKASVAVIHPKDVTSEKIQKNYSAVSFTGAAKKEPVNMSSVKEYNLINNYRIVTHNSKTNKMDLSFRIISEDYMNNNTAAALILSNMLSYGSIFRDKENLEKSLAVDGINSNLHASIDAISGSISCQSQDNFKAIKAFKEVLYNPRFTEAEFVRAKNSVKEVLKTSEKSAFDKLGNEIYKGLPRGTSNEQILEDLDKLTLNDIKQQYYKIIQNCKGEIAVSAPFDKNPNLKNEIFANFASFNPVKPHTAKQLENVYKPVEQTKVLTDTDYKNQADIVEVYKFKASDNIKDVVAIELLNTILGGSSSSRLFMDLREKEKLAYHVNSYFDYEEDIGTFGFSIGTTTDNKETGEKSFENVKKSIDGFNRHVQKITCEKVTDEELRNAKLNFKNYILECNQNQSGKNSSFLHGLNSPYGISKENLIFEEIDKITADDILNAARYIFAGKPTYSIVATEDTLKANEEYLKSLTD